MYDLQRFWPKIQQPKSIPYYILYTRIYRYLCWFLCKMSLKQIQLLAVCGGVMISSTWFFREFPFMFKQAHMGLETCLDQMWAVTQLKQSTFPDVSQIRTWFPISSGEHFSTTGDDFPYLTTQITLSLEVSTLASDLVTWRQAAKTSPVLCWSSLRRPEIWQRRRMCAWMNSVKYIYIYIFM